MASTYVYKAEGDRGKKGILLTPQEGTRNEPYAVLADGTRIKGQYVNTNEGRHQFLFGNDILGQKGVKIEYDGKSIDLEDANKSYEGSNPYDGWEYRNKGDLGSGGGSGGGGYPAGFGPGVYGSYGAYPGYLGGMFPDPTFANFDPVKRVPFKYTDPYEFTAKYGELSRGEVRKNAELAKELSLDQITAELEGLRQFAPQASALKRETIAQDNAFNQGQRNAQLKSTIPGLDERLSGVRSDLEAQGRRANIYASGRAPDEVTDRGLELTARSRAADRSTGGGFGGMAANKTSDLLSAETRLGIAQYGENLVTGNAAARQNAVGAEAQLRLAPTQYSDAGAQIRVTPSISGSQLAQSNLGQLNQLSMLSASQAFSGEVGQQQYITNLETNRRQFNATGNFNESQVNAGIANEFALTKFGYDVGYAGTLAGAAQTDINTTVGLQQQEAARQEAARAEGAAKAGNTIGAIASGIGTIASGAASLLGSGSAGGINVGGTTYTSGESVGGAEGSILVPAGQPIPEGYKGVQTASNGGTIAVPNGTSGAGRKPSTPTPSGPVSEDVSSGATPPSESSGPSGTPSESTPEDDAAASDNGSSDYPGAPIGDELYPGDSFARSARSSSTQAPQYKSPTLQSFNDATGLKVKANEQDYLLSQGAGVLRDAGIHSAPSAKASVPIGASNTGRQLYGDQAKMAVQTPKVGSDYVGSFFETLNPLGVFDAKDKSTLQNIADVSGSVAFIDQLNTYYQNGESKKFINAIAQKFKTPLINSITNDPNGRAGLKSAFSAYNLFTNWDRMSPGQKGLGLASVGLNAYQYSSGEDLRLKPIIEAGKGKLGLNVGQALELFQTGYNVYSMVNNWQDLNNIQKLAYGTQSVSGVADLAKQFNLLGSGVGGAAVQTSAAQLANAGFSAAPGWGIGAVQGTGAIPAGYTGIASLPDGGIVAVPAENAGSAAVGTLGTVAAVAGIAAGAATVYSGWGTGGAKGALNGAIGGSSIAAGMYTLGATNPYLLGAIVAVSVLGDTIKTGKEEHQVQRDAVRGVYQNAGLADKNYNVTLADGTLVNIGVDGKGGRHGVTNPDLLSPEQKGKIKDLSAYDVDYTNDLDYASSMGGTTLSRLLSGGTSTNVNQMGGQLGNAAIANIGFGKEMSATNFEKLAQNQRAMFAQSGIKSKTDAMQLLNMAYAEKRLSASDYTAGQQAVNMFFDKDGFNLAKKLMSGRQRGVEVASSNPSESKPTTTINYKTGTKSNATTPQSGASQPAGNTASSVPTSYQTNRSPAAPAPLAESGAPTSYRTRKPEPAAARESNRTAPSLAAPSKMRLSKEELRARNKSQYSSGASA